MAFATVAIVAGATVLIASGIDAGIKNKRANDAAIEASNLNKAINTELDNREPVYDASGKIREMKSGIDALKGDVDDMKSLVTNPYANLGVATEAAEIQMEQTDIALANTLDTIAATGAGAGGATALAQAALQSKRGVAADIQKQEVQNQKLRAQGDQQVSQQLLSLEQQKLSLEGRKIDIEGQAISAEERAAGGRADREQAAIDRLYGEYDFQRSTEIANRQASSDAIIGGLQTVGGAGLSIAGAGLTGAPSSSNEPVYDYGASGLQAQDPRYYTPTYAANPNQTIADVTGPVPSYSNPGSTSGVDITSGQTAVDLSDRRLKHDYKIIGKSKSGLNIYEFSYIHKPGRYTGVMSDEISKEAVVVDENGYDMVDYSKIDVDFKKL
jgi:hypothetical protein